jgi:hypothetical protein
MAELLRMLPRDESIEDKFKTLLNNDPLGATVRTLPLRPWKEHWLTEAGTTRLCFHRYRYCNRYQCRCLPRFLTAAPLQHHRIRAPSPPCRREAPPASHGQEPVRLVPARLQDE